ncbi:acyl-[acyl-carrier-protein] thioesterase [Desulfovibrio psychrotolerans]|uniref:Acyl-ACP thioesterase n=1 Tax=Desulfovibrio psychrotolerans TaxID=415242 RepID=A0A7J0BSF0_9BACT|nr:acyl-ACP thioesterase domain-containing protein [Desulfovibrio psychrotolerans]GFM36643.1 acyl-ACP thioesterase [Desulfovibrio psychrotolerans]
MPVYGTENVVVRCYETGPGGLARPATFADYFQEAASNNARALGFPGERLWAQGMAWVLARLALHIHRYPAAGETVCIRTWPAAHDRTIAQRCYEATDVHGQPLAWGTSAWVVMDISTRRMLPIPDFVAQGYPKDQPDCRPFATRAVPKLRETAHEALLRSRRADMDANGHVNNARYVDWVLEAMPQDFAAAHEPSMVDITFRAECGAGVPLVSFCSAPEEQVSLHSLRLASATAQEPRADHGSSVQPQPAGATPEKSAKPDSSPAEHAAGESANATELCRARVIWRARPAHHAPEHRA